MIQAVTDDDERGALGMHYTSVPNILKVLSPLFLDELRAKLDEAGDNSRALLNLRKRMAKIRVFDPACGSGNFLVIAYKESRRHPSDRRRPCYSGLMAAIVTWSRAESNCASRLVAHIITVQCSAASRHGTSGALRPSSRTSADSGSWWVPMGAARQPSWT